MRAELFMVAACAALAACAGIRENAKAIPVTDEVDVLVVGGTSSGVAAALAAKEAGARVYLAGEAPYLGEDVAGTLELGWECVDDGGDALLKRLREDETDQVPYAYRHPKNFKFVGGWQYHNDAIDKFKVVAMPANPGDCVLYLDTAEIECVLNEPERVASVEVVVIENCDEKADAAKSVDHRGAIQPGQGRGPLTGRVSAKACDGDRSGTVFELVRQPGATLLAGEAVRAGEPAANADGCARGFRCVTYALRVDAVLHRVRIEAQLGKGAACQLVSRVRFRRGGGVKSVGVPSPLKVKKTFDAVLMEKGIPFLTGAPVTELVADAKGEVCGAVFANRSGRQAVLAKSVVDATCLGRVTRLGRGIDGIRGPTKFTRVVMAATPPAGVAVEELKDVYPISNHNVSKLTPELAGQPLTGRVWRCALTLDMKDGSHASFAAAELAARDRTWVPSTLDAADRLRLVDVPEAPSRKYVRFANDRGTLAEKFARGRACGRAAYEETKGRGALAGAHVERTVDEAGEEIGEVREALGGLRPYDGFLPRRTIPAAAGALPELGTYDVVVVGGGTAGAPTATAAARAGAKTLLAEYLHILGGVSTEGLIMGYYCGNHCGFTQEYKARVRNEKADVGLYRGARAFTGLCREAGTEIWYGAFGEGAVVKDGRVVGVVVVTPQGRGVVRARCVVDATGDSDVAAAAGAETEFIGATDFALQSAGQAPHRLGRGGINSDFNLVNDPCAWDLWAFGVRSRAGQPDSWDVAQVVDSRERRRIVPDYCLMGWDVVTECPFPDTMVQTSSKQDSHGFLKDEYGYVAEAKKHDGKEFRSNVPLRSCLPKGLTALAVVGLGKGVARDVVPVTRMRADLQNEGYSLGTMAAEAARNADGDFRRVDVKKVQRVLVEKGILRAEVLDWTQEPEVTDETLAAAMATVGDGFRGSGLALAYPERTLPHLRREYAAAKDAAARQAYALVLGVLGDATGAETLVDLVSHRASLRIPRDRGPYYSGSLFRLGLRVALGRTKAACAVEPLRAEIAALDAGSSIGDVRMACLGAEAHGSKAFAPALAALLRTKGVGGWARREVRELAPTGGYGIGPECERCIRELTVARALYACGDEDGLARATLEAYAKDPRGVFAEHANRVLRAHRGGDVSTKIDKIGSDGK